MLCLHQPVLPRPFRILSPDHTIFITPNSILLKVRSIIPAALFASPKSSSRSSRTDTSHCPRKPWAALVPIRLRGCRLASTATVPSPTPASSSSLSPFLSSDDTASLSRSLCPPTTFRNIAYDFPASRPASRRFLAHVFPLRQPHQSIHFQKFRDKWRCRGNSQRVCSIPSSALRRSHRPPTLPRPSCGRRTCFEC